MDDKTKARFAAVLERKRNMEIDAENERQAQLRRDQEYENAKKETMHRWQQTVADMKAAIASANGVIKGEGATFSMGKVEHKEPPALFGFPINLHMDDAVDRKIYLNVSDVGRVKPVFILTHTGKAPPDFSIFDATEDFYADILASFLSQAVDSRARPAKTR